MARRAMIAQAVRAHPPRTAVAPNRPASTGYGVRTNRPLPKPQPKPTLPTGTSAPGPTIPAVAPWDSGYEQAVAGARAKYNNANIGLDYREQATQQDFGLAPGFNDFKSNPYSRAALLEQAYQRANRGSSISMAAQGQLYAGSLSNALGSNRAQYAQGRDELGRAYRDALQNIQQERLAAQAEMAEGITSAGFERYADASATPLDPTAAPAPKQNRKRVIRQAVSQNRPVRKR